jgi:hypothetical protein
MRVLLDLFIILKTTSQTFPQILHRINAGLIIKDTPDDIISVCYLIFVENTLQTFTVFKTD